MTASALAGRLAILAFGLVWFAFHGSRLKRWYTLDAGRDKFRYYLLVPYWIGCSVFGLGCIVLAFLPLSPSGL